MTIKQFEKLMDQNFKIRLLQHQRQVFFDETKNIYSGMLQEIPVSNEFLPDQFRENYLKAMDSRIEVLKKLFEEA